VLDVGAGAGRYVARVAPLVAKVTAVEPSPAMREQLGQVVREAGLANVEIIAAAWPGAEVEPADVVICSHVAYFVEEIAPFLQKLRRVNRGHASVVHRHVQREAMLLPLFEQVWGEPRCPEPSFADLFGAAAQLELWANVATVPFGFAPRFESLDEAIQLARADLLNPPEDRTPIIRDYLAAHLVEEEGKLGFVRPATRAGVLWWEADA
jgi:SAM-dependent methyltransferase